MQLNRHLSCDIKYFIFNVILEDEGFRLIKSCIPQIKAERQNFAVYNQHCVCLWNDFELRSLVCYETMGAERVLTWLEYKTVL